MCVDFTKGMSMGQEIWRQLDEPRRSVRLYAGLAPVKEKERRWELS